MRNETLRNELNVECKERKYRSNRTEKNILAECLTIAYQHFFRSFETEDLHKFETVFELNQLQKEKKTMALLITQ